MNIYLLLGILIVNFALISYTIFFFKIKSPLKIKAVIFLVLGVLLDVTSTVLMIIGSHKSVVTFHGLIGYTALIGMIAELIVILRTYVGRITVTGNVLLLTRLTYFWWIFVYAAGLVLVMKR